MKKPLQTQIQNPPHFNRNRPPKSTLIPHPLSSNLNQIKLLLSSPPISNPSFDNVSCWNQSQRTVQHHTAVGGELSPSIDDNEEDERAIAEGPHEGGALAGGQQVIIMDILWNAVFVVAAAVGLIVSSSEWPKLPLSMWVVGYVIQCVMHVVCVCVEHWERGRRGMSSLRDVAVREFNREVNWRDEENKR